MTNEVMATTNPTVAQPRSHGALQAVRTYVPHADIAESADALFLRLDLPGVEQDGVRVRIERDVLTVEGRIAVEGYENLVPVHIEHGVGHFRRSFQIPSQVETERIDAKLRDGVLELVLPKSGAARVRRIEVAAG